MIEENFYRNYLSNLLNGNRAECSAHVQRLLEEDINLKDLYSQLFRRSLYEVGEMWENNQISVAKEHLATAITDGLLSHCHPKVFSGDRIGKKVVISCAANEYHQIGGKMVADIFELNGWDSHFLGVDTPYKDLVEFIEETQPDVVGFSLSILSNIQNLETTIESIKVDYPKIDLFVGGQAFRWGGTEIVDNYSNTEYIPTLDDLEMTIR